MELQFTDDEKNRIMAALQILSDIDADDHPNETARTEALLARVRAAWAEGL